MTVKDLIKKLSKQPGDVEIEFLLVMKPEGSGEEAVQMKLWDLVLDPLRGDDSPAVVITFEQSTEDDEDCPAQ